ncbi:MAG TPA: carboxypeptidase regulatory-like domain-containing protein [Candidatus Dormibacteraeota bacterium]|nr:carboxypeptidase regulatory-like domain-containing protein [Candidatus Dormibacteraeota bacterium]
MVKRHVVFFAGRTALICLIACGMSAALRAQAPAQSQTPAQAPQQPAAAANTGQITGMISYQGQKPEVYPINMTNDPVCAELHSGPVIPADGAVNPNGSLPNAFVYLQSSDGKLPSTPPTNPVILAEKGCQYLPHVLGVMVGQTFEVVNMDPTTHNVHVLPKLNPQWNVSQLPGSSSVVRKFLHPDIMIPVRCNVHPWMKAYVGVVDNPFYTVTGNQGVFTLKEVPPGEYTLRVWTASFGAQERHVTVRAGETTTADFTMGSH